MNIEQLLNKIDELAKPYLNQAKRKELITALAEQELEVVKRIANDDFFFNEVHLHSEYSLLDGVSPVDKYIEQAVKLGHKAMAVSDHGVTHGWYKLRGAADKGIKPLFGCEIYLHHKDRMHHMLLLAENTTGYRNILHIVSEGHMNKSNTSSPKPNVSKEILEQYNEGIIATSSCLGGVVGKGVMSADAYEDIKEDIQYWTSVFKGRFYIEVQDYDVENEDNLEDFMIEFLEKQRRANDTAYRIAEDLNLPLVATNDVHYPSKGDHEVQDILLCIHNKDKLDNPERFRFQSHLHYMKDKWEMLWRFRKHPSAVFNTQEIADRCNIEYQDNYLLPTYPYLPKDKSQLEYFKEKVQEGIKEFYSKKKNYRPLLQKFGCSKEELWNMIQERASFEISVFENMGFEGYMMIVAWVSELAKENKILVGPGRGSAAGSIVALALDITAVCPLRYDLLFERFLNPDRIEMPDIDVDFQYELRSKLIELVADELGHDKVSQIITFGRMKARAAIREVGRVMGMPLNIVDRIAKLVPFGADLTEALEVVPDMRKEYETKAQIKTLLDYALMIEGKPKNYSVHAAGVILSSDSIPNHTAFQKSKTALLPVTQAEMNDIDGYRLVKQDFLGLRMLSVIKFACDLILERTGVDIDPYDIPKDDPKTYELLASGKSVACFQLESKGMRQLLEDIQVEDIEDVIDCIALYRPGVLKVGMHNTYVKNKFNPEGIEYLHSSLEPILSPSRGIMIYQEQAMIIANKVAGFSMADADKLRKAIGKKKEDLMAKLKVQFVEGCQTVSGISKEKADEIWHLIEVMASYSFNKSHSVAYGFISVDTAYLKANYPLEYMTSAIAKAAEAKSPKLPLYIEEAKEMGLEVTPPDINLSDVDFSISNDKIVFGLRAIRDVGKASQLIMDERENNGPFKSVIDFRRRCKVNKKVFTALVRAGAFDNMGVHRNQLLACLDELLEIKPTKKSKKKQENAEMLQLALDMFENNDEDKKEEKEEFSYPDVEEPTKNEIAEAELDMLGIYVTHHPLSDSKVEMDKIVTVHADEVDTLEEDQLVIIGGLIKEKKQFVTKKKQEEMGKYTIDDMTGDIDVISFPRQYANMKNFGEKDVVLIKGRVNYNEKFTQTQNNDDDENKDADYEIQIVAEEMVFFNSDARHKIGIPNATESNIQEQEEQPVNVNTNGQSLSQYLESIGNPKVVIV